jgi:phage-related protein (TIGR01555 family)
MGAWSRFKNMTADAKAAAMSRMDTWANALTGLATSRDKTTHTLPYLSPILAPQMLEAMYHDDDIAARIVSAVPDEAYREGFTVISKAAQTQVNEFLDRKPQATFDDLRAVAHAAMQKESQSTQQQATELQKALDNHGAVQKFREAHTWGRLYGLGAIFLGVDDGRDPWEPVDVEAVRGINFMTVLDKRDLIPWRWYADPQAPKFSDVAIYLMQPVGVYVGAPYEIENTEQVLLLHESRMIRFGGDLTSKRLRLANQGADYSVLQKCFRALQLVNDNWQSSAALLADASQGVFSIRGLIDMIAGNADTMIQRFEFMDLIRSSFRAILLDAGDQAGPGETFTRVPTPFQGIPEMLDQTWTRVAAAARMPKQILLGEPPGGLNAGGTADANVRWWYDTVKATQQQAVRPQVEYVLRLEATARGYKNVDDWSIVFPPLWQLTEKEVAEMHESQANADKVYAEAGWLTPEEGALSRWGGGKYSLETKIDVATRKRTMAATMQTMEQEAQNALETAQDPAPMPGVISAQETTASGTPDPVPPRVTET